MQQLKNLLKLLIGIGSIALHFETANAYSSFISYGYNSCITCHYNSHGNGALNDYGRALWSGEIASRSFYNPKLTDEQIAESSGFLGKTTLPWWIRPGVKYRGLWFQTNPGSPTSTSRLIHMQADVNAAVHLDQDQKYVVVGSYGYLPDSTGESGTWISREHYFRMQWSDELYIFAGLMDKVFGIRTPDHTAFSRTRTGLDKNDQSHGLILHWFKNPWEYTLNAFVGNLAQSDDLRQKGLSFMVEKDLHQYLRTGGALLYSNNNYLQWTRAEIHSKWGFGKGHSLISELGYIENKPKDSASTKGLYTLIEAVSRITRGYNFLSQIEYYNPTMSADSADQYRWSFGLLAFPAPRYELRAQLINSKKIADSGVLDDSWMAQTQLHLSF